MKIIKINIVVKKALSWLISAVIIALLIYRLQGVPAAAWWPHHENATWLIIIAVVLMPFNWWLELVKWRLLFPQADPPKSRQLISPMLYGITAGLLTPWRVGAYGGRAYGLEVQYRLSGLTSQALGNIAQLIVLIGGGVCAAVVHGSSMGAAGPRWAIFYIIAVLLILLLSFSYLYPDILLRAVKPLLKSDKIRRLKEQLRQQSRFIRAKALVLSIARYGVYTAQYIFLLKAWIPTLNVGRSVSGVALLFAAQTGLPLPPAGSVAARAIWSDMIWPEAAQLASFTAVSTSLFIINLGIPALVGIAVFSVSLSKK